MYYVRRFSLLSRVPIEVFQITLSGNGKMLSAHVSFSHHLPILSYVNGHIIIITGMNLNQYYPNPPTNKQLTDQRWSCQLG